MSRKIVVLLFAVSFLVSGPGLAQAAGSASTTGEEPQAQQAAPKQVQSLATRTAVRLNTAYATTATQGIKKVVLTPALAPQGFGDRELEAGQIVGVIDTTNINNIPNGHYDIFVSKTGNVWQAHLDSNGQIVARSKSVKVTNATTMKRPEIKFNLTILIQWGKRHIWIEL
jgi:hypothetical protein